MYFLKPRNHVLNLNIYNLSTLPRWWIRKVQRRERERQIDREDMKVCKDPASQANPTEALATHACIVLDVDFDAMVIRGSVEYTVEIQVCGCGYLSLGRRFQRGFRRLGVCCVVGQPPCTPLLADRDCVG